MSFVIGGSGYFASGFTTLNRKWLYCKELFWEYNEHIYKFEIPKRLNMHLILLPLRLLVCPWGF